MERNLTLEARSGLPDTLRILVEKYPRNLWESHHNFDALTRFWLERHLAFRDLLARIDSQTQAFLDDRQDHRRYASQSAQLIGHLLNDLHGHHQIEDTHYFPKLAALDPHLDAGFALLDGDHQALDGHIHGLADATNAMLRVLQAKSDKRAVADLHQRVQDFARFIDRHLIDEEELVIPAILHFAPDL